MRLSTGTIMIALVAGAFTLAACAHRASSVPTPTQQTAQEIGSGNPHQRVVALTFDAGYESVYTDQVLDILKEKGVKASIAMTGVFAERYPDLLLRMVNEGHVLMNHSYHHWHFVHTVVFPGTQGLTQAQRWDELDKTEAIVKNIAGVSTKPYFRPPYGDYNDSVNADVYADGYRYNVLWSIDSRGWQSVPPDQIIPNVLSRARPGAIILFHLGVVQDAVALPAIIVGLRGKGFGFVTVPELIAALGK
jgi:peptidoglycan/xylan/chitin deacetylase (PgdA/CDA1 family)